MPSHLTWEEGYPLAAEPTPDELKFIELKLGDRKVIVQEDGHVLPADQVLRKTLSGPGWTRELSSVATEPERVEHIDHAVEMGFMQYITAKGKEKETGGNKRPHDPSTPMPVDSATMRPRSPPRKKIRPSEGMMMDDGVPVSPPSSPDDESMFKAESPQIGSGFEMAALFSLPALLTHFEKLPDKVQQHVLMHMFRRSRMPTIQAISAFASTALKRDFITLLPHEIAVQVLKKLDVKSLSVAANVSKAWRKKIDQERSVWRTRLVEDGLWYGHGVEDEEEQSIRRRYEALDRRGGKRRVSKAGTPSEDEPMSVDRPAMFERSSPVQQLERATPLKHVYRRRFTSDRNWLHATPQHTTFAGHGTNVVTCVQFDEDKIVSASDDHSINIYDTETGALRKRLDGHEGGVWALEYKGDTLVSGSTDRTVRIWDLEDLVQTHTFAGHTSTVRCLQIVEPVYDEVTGEFQPPYPLIITGSRDASLRVWKLPKKGEPAYNGAGNNSQPPPPDENPFHVHHLEGHGEAVRALAAHGRICVSGSYDKTVRVWDIVKGTCIHVLHGHEAKVYSIVYDKYRNRCASGSMDNTVKIWDLATGKCLHTLTGHTSLVGLLGLSPNRIVSAAADASLRVWDANTYELQHTLSSHAAAITCFQHDETKVVSGSDGTLKLWDIKTGRFICDLITGISSVWQVAFYGNLLVAASNRNGNTVFDVFDFGKKSEVDHSGIDDDKLDLLRRAPWERGNPHEPQTYQVEDEGGDDEDVFCVGTEDALSPKTHEKWRAMSVRSQRPVRRGRSRVASSGPGDGQGSKRAFRLGVAFGDRGREGDRLSTREVGDRLSRVRSEPGATRTRVGPWTQTQMFQSAEASGSGSASGSGTASGSGAASAPGEGEDEGEGELGLLDVDVNMGREVE
ncbi:hypothetical protein CcaverHIS641_0107720 [Cutaneotrichosporon cavernicola]|nr:hypothetical protein CcaverHIS641_0107720 [Cutaneotrichosporon cavernicola]